MSRVHVGLRTTHSIAPRRENTAAQRSLDSSVKRIVLVRIETSYSFAIRHGTSSETGETSQLLRSKKCGSNTAPANAFACISCAWLASSPRRACFGVHIMVGDGEGCSFKK